MTLIESRLIVGLEIHVQLATRTKMFCACPVETGAPPNTCVCPVCLGHPGALPVINRRAVALAIRVGLALGCKIAAKTKWDRKGYFYPDLPKNYQISQYDLPIAADGLFEIPVGGGLKAIRIRRAHLEEDAGKNIHDTPGCTLVDLNRTGTPLLEIVTEPDIESAAEAYTFCTELQRLIRHLGVSEASMQKGHMRFEPNVNLVITTEEGESRTPIVEIKNLNSFRSVRRSIEFEHERQLAAWRADDGYRLGTAPNENRGWDDDRGTTEFQRTKEGEDDYRYFPDPDLVPVEVDQRLTMEVREGLPELPVARRMRLVDAVGLSLEDAAVIVDERAPADLFDAIITADAPAERAGKQFVNVWLPLAAERGVGVADLKVDARRMARLARITEDGLINRTAATSIAARMTESADDPESLAESLGLVQIRDVDATAKWVDEAFAANPKAVEDAVGNPKKAKGSAGFLRGQVMKLSGGKADPKLVGKLIEEKLDAMRSR